MVHAEIRGDSVGRWRQTTAGFTTTAMFSVFAGYFFGNFREKASIIIQRYAVPRRLPANLKMHDLE